jgi:hypothetical protein
MLDGKWAGLIAEVKGSESVTIGQVESAFTEQRLRVATLRLGLSPAEVVPTLAQELTTTESLERNGIIYLKVLFASSNDPIICSDNRWKTIPLTSVEAFIEQRIEAYLDPKFGGRYFFPSALFQYIVWKRRSYLL